MRLSTWTATSISVARRSSVCARNRSPITCFHRPKAASARARFVYPDAVCQAMRPWSAICWRWRSRCVGSLSAVSYDLRLIRPVWLAWATSGSLSRDGADRDRGPGNGLRRLGRDRRALRSTGWQAARRHQATGARPAAARGSSSAGRRAGDPRARPGSARCASRRCRAQARSCARVPPPPRGQTRPAARRRTAWTPRSTRTRRSRPRCYGADGGEDVTIVAGSNAMERPMAQQLDDLSRSLTPLEQDSTIIAVIEMSQASWLVAGIVPGIERHPLKKLEPSEGELLRLLMRWRAEATQKGRTITRIAVAFAAGRDGFWLARWLRARGIEAYVIHPTSVAVSREHRRAKTDRLDTGLLKRVFLGWLRGEPDHCHMAAIPTLAEEDAKRPNREREGLVRERTRLVNRMKGCLARFGVRTFKPTLRNAPDRLATLQTPEGGTRERLVGPILLWADHLVPADAGVYDR